MYKVDFNVNADVSHLFWTNVSEVTLRDCSKTMLFNNSNYCPPSVSSFLSKRDLSYSVFITSCWHFFNIFFSFWFSCMECYLRTITFIATSLMALRVTDHSNEHIRVGGVVLNFPPPISQGCRKGEGQGRRLRAGWKSAHFVLPSQDRLVTAAKQKSYYARDKTFPNERHTV